MNNANKFMFFNIKIKKQSHKNCFLPVHRTGRLSYMQHYKINDILDLASDGWKILQIDKKIKGII